MKVKRMALMEELMFFSEKAWKYKDSCGIERTAHKATREPGSQNIKFKNRGNGYVCESFGESIDYPGMMEVVTFSEWKKKKFARASI